MLHPTRFLRTLRARRALVRVCLGTPGFLVKTGNVGEHSIGKRRKEPRSPVSQSLSQYVVRGESVAAAGPNNVRQVKVTPVLQDASCKN